MIHMLIALTLALISTPCSGQESKPIVLNFETEEEMLAATERTMTDFDTALERFISWNHSKLKEHEELYRSLNDWDSQLSKLEALKKQILLTNQLFLEFRNQCAETIALSFEGKSEKREMHALTQFSLTTWYIDFLKSSLFPKHWEERAITPATPKTPQG